MNQMRRQSLVAYGQALQETVIDPPQPQGHEVLVRIERCGVCHSDLHLQDGYFSLGGDKKLDVSSGRTLPFTLGHEIAGVVETTGPEADAAAVGRHVAVYPWIGCGTCQSCIGGEENLCSNHRHLGIAVDGGFATHVLVPHSRYLLDFAPLAPAFAGPLMCSGLTAYAALKRHANRPERGPLLLIGLGGVGMMGLAIARALFRTPPIVADIDADKRQAALAAGAAQAYDPSDPQARKAIMSATGGLLAICDFVGSDKSLQFASGLLARGGKIVVTGLLGGNFSIAAAMFGIKAMTIEGTLTGTLDEARELLDLVRGKNIAPIPTHGRPLNEAQGALDDLRAGRVVGRTVLSI
ncbi:MAG: alcohol dehydrogenase catalytic domain-containing protein [Hyphomicrobiales bacterium]|nr:alcohol dehydrogenase catalytic domain-containing protein [Hyphomicrobiales bacterium]MDE2373747.1 alcohol dehydrogenase catalytic domain-containing protein [Hyphomicrobiales bacterium]